VHVIWDLGVNFPLSSYIHPSQPNSFDMSADASIGISAASFSIAVVALVAALMQITMQIDIEARRKGKIDRLALGDWAIDNPELKLFIHLILQLGRMKSPWGDPRILTVPFITVGEIENYLQAEMTANERPLLARRIKTRLVESATNSIALGGGRYSGRMYAVRATTRKRCEACWSDAMDMCGMTRGFWSLLTAASAQACDGQVRPANAVTNIHSLWGFGRIMGLRQVTRTGTRITMTNGGASLYLDLSASVDRPTRLAHFSGSPNGRYLIIEEMSQHTAQSVYADAVWSSGNVPDELRLCLKGRKSDSPAFSQKTLILPTRFVDIFFVRPSQGVIVWDDAFEAWSKEFVAELGGDQTKGEGVTDILSLVRTPVAISCIRTYPVGELLTSQLSACYQALSWCIRYWSLCPYQLASLLCYRQDAYRPRLPIFGIKLIGPEFVTSGEQCREWCMEAVKSLESATTLVDERSWNHIVEFTELKVENSSHPMKLTSQEHIILVKLLQCWRLMIIEEQGIGSGGQYWNIPTSNSYDSSTSLLVTLTLATVAIATDSLEVGDSEVNKAIEIELGGKLEVKV
jgi:hypothetical protein